MLHYTSLLHRESEDVGYYWILCILLQVFNGCSSCYLATALQCIFRGQKRFIWNRNVHVKSCLQPCCVCCVDLMIFILSQYRPKYKHFKHNKPIRSYILWLSVYTISALRLNHQTVVYLECSTYICLYRGYFKNPLPLA